MTFNITPRMLLSTVVPPFVIASEIEPAYASGLRVAEATLVVMVALFPDAIVVALDVTASQPPPESTVGAILTLPVQSFVLIVKLCELGFDPAVATKLCPIAEGSTSVHCGVFVTANETCTAVLPPFEESCSGTE